MKPALGVDDGIFWVSREEFFNYFKTIYLSASDMTAFLEPEPETGQDEGAAATEEVQPEPAEEDEEEPMAAEPGPDSESPAEEIAPAELDAGVEGEAQDDS